MADHPAVSLVVPVYDEEENLPDLIDQIRAALGDGPPSWELLLVDDGSRDRSWEIIARRGAADPRVRGLRFAANRGQTAAFAAGFRAARGELVVTLDADLQNDPADIPRLLELQREKDADVVLGVRARRNDSLVRRWSSKLANGYRRWRTGDDAIDTGCSLKVFRTRFVREMPLFTGLHRFLPTLARMQGARRVEQTEVNHRPRTRGVSKYGVWNRLWVGLADVKAVTWMQKRHLGYEIAEESGGE
ncbi:MAG: glycosyltransferase family 2 protein [Planctomycetes bacterium]|nr:glycosyltransferase family 2 protein [Planctomycetota bacterium]MBL7008648.1 glycosyltransferase family 2 protein [Planctomycetota bacterium]